MYKFITIHSVFWSKVEATQCDQFGPDWNDNIIRMKTVIDDFYFVAFSIQYL